MFADPPNLVAADYLERATEGFSEGRQLGTGSFGIVYRGEADGLEFAVKRLNDVTSAERELAVLARFQHPHIIRLLGFTPACTTPRCLVYELAARGSLEHIFREEDESPSAWHPLTWKTRVRIGVGVSTALNFLHRSQAAPVFHRDVKAANICLMSDFTPKLIDCGVSMLIDEARAQTGVTSYSATGDIAIGTAEYMCSRYARSRRYGEKAEVYSFGIVLMELLTSRVNHAGDLLFEVFIEDAEEDLAEARDRRAGDWPANVAATIAQLARQSLGTGADYARRPTMMAVMRELRRLEAAHCQRTADEMQLLAELEGVRAQLAHLRMEAASAAPAVTLHTCIVCFDEEVPADRGVACRGPDAHFTCDGCLERIVIDTATQVRETNELVAQAAAAEAGGDRRRVWFLTGRVCCPSRMPDCPSDPYADGAVARHVSEAAFAAHMHARTLLPIAREAQQVFERAQETMRAEVERIRAQVRAGLEVEQGRALLAAQLRQQMPNARQCRQCGFGPIDHMACADLQAHHGQQFGNARINNACPQCGWFSRNVGDWPAWDGRLPQEANTGLAEAGAQRRQEVEEQRRQEQEAQEAARRQQQQAQQQQQQAQRRQQEEAQRRQQQQAQQRRQEQEAQRRQQEEAQRRQQGASGSWQPFVDVNLVGTGMVTAAGIYDLQGNPWAYSAGFAAQVAEVAAVSARFSMPTALAATGVTIAGVGYMFVRGEENADIYVKKGHEGVYFWRCNTCILVAYHNDRVQPGQCAHTVAKLGDFLKESGI
mmetsp:Transcript_223/g.575  ORF Transcript_223/g.575 Transcript_223/m.575 type:complete len:770 (-) Transcript_223:592-2901(-)